MGWIPSVHTHGLLLGHTRQTDMALGSQKASVCPKSGIPVSLIKGLPLEEIFLDHWLRTSLSG